MHFPVHFIILLVLNLLSSYVGSHIGETLWVWFLSFLGGTISQETPCLSGSRNAFMQKTEASAELSYCVSASAEPSGIILQTLSSSFFKEQLGPIMMSMDCVTTGVTGSVHVEIQGPCWAGLPLAGSEIAGPVPFWSLLQKSWPAPAHGRDGPTPCHGVWPWQYGPRRAGSAPWLREVVPVAWTDWLSYHTDPHPGPWVGPP